MKIRRFKTQKFRPLISYLKYSKFIAFKSLKMFNLIKISPKSTSQNFKIKGCKAVKELEN